MEIQEVAQALVDENKAVELVERMRWPNGPICPHCGENTRIYALKGKTTRLGLRKCGRCRKQFTVRVGTIFEDSHIPLSKWLYAIRLMCASKKGVSANQLMRELGITYKSAWFMCHRVRYAMTKPPLSGKLGMEGQIVEVDETYIGGKAGNNKHKDFTPKEKPIVMTLIERDGDVRTVKLPNTKRGTLQTVVRMNVCEAAHIMTDSHTGYPGLKKHFRMHDTVNHSQEYVRGIIHTNFAESYHSLLKRGIFGTYHHVSEKHLSRYLREFEFRWNSRKATDGARAVEAVRGAEGKRLTYRTPTAKRRSSLI